MTGKKFETIKQNKAIALSILHVPYNSEEIKHAFISKHNSTRESQVTLLMIGDGGKQHYLAVKRFSPLLSKITSKHDGDFYFLDCLHLFRTENKLNTQRVFTSGNRYI